MVDIVAFDTLGAGTQDVFNWGGSDSRHFYTGAGGELRVTIGLTIVTWAAVPADTIIGTWFSDESDAQRAQTSWNAGISTNTVTTTTPVTAETLSLGAFNGSPNLDGWIFESLVYNRKFSSGEEACLRGWVTAKYGIAWS